MGVNAVVNQNRESSRMGRASFWGEPRRHSVVFQGQVLLLENLKERRQLMRDMLVKERFEVGVVDDARDAVQLLSEGLFSGPSKAPELIIGNARMLGDAGLAALERLCASHPEVPVILYSAFTSPKLRERMARIHGVCILDASADLEDLRTTALALVSSRQTSL
ncbi:response regulator [Archangium violaceum]|uniref:response regulator n=1 Tax=Archangium violaceum TaxID=83451 RepID=UPI00193C63D7|nr:response regulator [Archangium violaceum]QRK07528.1 response regulator [Archangium violaceum]